MVRSLFARNGYRRLGRHERHKLLAHLQRLPEIDLRHRFETPLDPDELRAHVDRPVPDHEIIGWFHHGALRGAAEIYYREDLAEAGVTVEPAWRGQGIGAGLVHRAMIRARRRGARSLTIHSNRGNAPMLAIAAKFGALETVGQGHAIEPLEAEPALTAWFSFDLTAPPPGLPGGWVRRLRERLLS